MKYSMMKTLGLGVIALSLSACGAGERLANIGKAPELTPIKDIKAPLAQRSISLPMPSNEPSRHEANSLWRTGARAFFKDQRASRIGDILTVDIAISDNAQIGNTSTRARATTENAGLSNFLGFEQQLRNILHGGAPVADPVTGITPADTRPTVTPGTLIGADSNTSYNGSGTVNRSEAINMTVAAIVTDVLPNGNMVIQGRQEVRVNFEKRELLLAGIVRPEDISSTNVIAHTQIAEARISYGGKGQITDVQQPRYGTQVYDVIFPF
jgi:flagellar L-ring protein precursor FlgH